MAYKLLVPADIISSGEIADAHISVSSVEQHEAALEINEMGISGLLNLGEFLASTDTAPSEPGHMTRKAYVDAQIAAMGGSGSEDLAAAVATLEAADAAEQARALAAEGGLSEALAAAVSTLEAADTAEQARAEAAEGVNAQAIEALQSDHTADAQALADFISSSTDLHNADAAALADYIQSNNAAAATDAQALADYIESNDGALATEASTARAAEQANATALANYIASNDAAVSADVQALADYIESNDSALATDVAALAQLRTEFDSLTEGLDNEQLDQIIEVIAAYESADSDLTDAIAALSSSQSSALAAETQARIDGDAAEAALREEDVGNLLQVIQAETQARTVAVAGAMTAVAELSAESEAGDEALQTSIDQMGVDYQAADAAMASDYDNKIAIADARAQAAEVVNAQAIADETAARVSAVESLQADLTADGQALADFQVAQNTRDGQQDSAIGDNIVAIEGLQEAKADAADLAAYISSNDSAVAADAAALAAYQTSNDAALAADVAALAAYISSNDDALAADVAALASYQASNDAAVGVERGRIDAILEGAGADTDSFADVVNLVNSIDTTNDQVFAGYVLSNDAALAQAITDFQTGDTTIQADLDAWKGSHVIGTDTQAHSSHLDSMEQGDFSSRQMKVKFETAGAGEGLVMGEDSFFVMCEAGSTVTLPAGADVGRKVQLKAGVLGGAAVTVVGMIDGQDGMTMSLDYASMSLVFSGSTWLIG